MIYQGKAFRLSMLEDDIVECCFDLQGESVNKFNETALIELPKCISILSDTSAKGLILTSAKESFIVGADITEFSDLFSQDEKVLLDKILSVNAILSSIEDLPIPTVAAINGLTLGGGFEYCLSADYRIITHEARVGLPEVKLGIYPGWGGTVRLSRLIGPDNAIEWICTGKEYKPLVALQMGAVDAVVNAEELLNSAKKILQQCCDGSLDFKARKTQKKSKLKLSNIESMLAFESAKAVVSQQAKGHYPAPVAAVKAMQKHAFLERDKALEVEARCFVNLAQSSVCHSLIQVFFNQQFLKKQAKNIISQATAVEKIAVLGAGIMGGGIAYQSASKNVPVLMKDIKQESINTGMQEANKLFNKLVTLKRLKLEQMGSKLTNITPTLSYGDFNTVDLVIEAVVENPDIKKQALAEVEKHVKKGTIITSNTSTIAIDLLASAISSPEYFCGMHFFNPVHRMPLVEVIRGKKTSDATIATVVNYAKTLGKTPVVVNDCPGFLVNRVLIPYFSGFCTALQDGADFQRIDTIMEKFGWPMGPAYLLDVIGLDTALHASSVMAQGYPDRMQQTEKNAIQVLYDNNRLGQKNNVGFYKYSSDKKGRPVKTVDPDIDTLLEKKVATSKEMSDEEIIDRLMIPMCMETIRALEEGIVNSPQEADMALVMGIGFPPFLCGPLKYIDAMGTDKFVALAEKYKTLGTIYHPTQTLKDMGNKQQTFYKK